MSKILNILFVTLFCISLSAHPWKPSHYVVIDTDAGLDDMRAITMILSSGEVSVVGVIVSGGALSPYVGYKKVKSLLNSFHHEGIPVAVNYNRRGVDMELPLSVSWGEEEGITVPETNGFNKLIKQLLENGNNNITLLSLASLNSAAELIDGGVLPAGAVKQIVWSNNNLSRLDGFNAGIDPRSANQVKKGDIPLVTVGYPSGGRFYTEEFIRKIAAAGSDYSDAIFKHFNSNPGLADHSFAVSAADEMAVLWLHQPELFRISEVGDHRFATPADPSRLKAAMIDLLDNDNGGGGKILKRISADTADYRSDLQPVMEKIISAHGPEEWEAAVIAGELHRHLGIYSVIGVKMGIRAREYFHAGIDAMQVISYAGMIPPISCMNDGLQVSTGATTGHGLLRVDESDARPFAEFSYNGMTLKVTLKKEIADRLNSELDQLVKINGIDSDIYWELLREKSILFWDTLDRHEIFDFEISGYDF